MRRLLHIVILFDEVSISIIAPPARSAIHQSTRPATNAMFTVEHRPKAQQHSPPGGLLNKKQWRLVQSSSQTLYVLSHSMTVSVNTKIFQLNHWTLTLTVVAVERLPPWRCVVICIAVVMTVVCCDVRGWYGDKLCDVTFPRAKQGLYVEVFVSLVVVTMCLMWLMCPKMLVGT